jgi:hypothetical protein
MQGGDTIEQTASMADQRDAKIPKVFRREARKHPFVDLVLAERRLVSLEA